MLKRLLPSLTAKQYLSFKKMWGLLLFCAVCQNVVNFRQMIKDTGLLRRLRPNKVWVEFPRKDDGRRCED
jgi:hypothetical protein